MFRELASIFPAATITATIVFDFGTTIPQNVSLRYDDVNLGLTYSENEFNYIHVCGQIGGIDDWPKFIDDTFTWLAPGGYTEYYDISLEFIRTSSVSELPARWVECSQILDEVSAETGRTFHVSIDECKGWMEAAGYIIDYGLHHNLQIDGSQDLRKILRGIVIRKVIGVITYHHYITGWNAARHRAYIKNLEHELTKDCKNVVVQL
jgi:hypothetical protein